MQYIILITIVLTSLIKRKSRILTLTLFLMLWLFFGFNTNNPDYHNYTLKYQGYNNSDLGFALILKLFYKLGFSYQHFLIIISFVGLLILAISIKKYTNDLKLVFALYFIFPFLLDIVQIRNFIVSVIIVSSIHYLESTKKIDTLKFIIAVLFATSIHSSAIFYLSFLLLRIVKIKHLSIFISLIILPLMSISYTNIIPFLVTNIYSNIKILNWFYGRTKLGLLLPISLQIIGFIIHFIGYKRLKNKLSYNSAIVHHSSTKASSKSKSLNTTLNNKYLNRGYLDTMLKINVIIFLLFPFYIFNTIFFRLYSNILILNYVVMGNAIRHAFINKYERLFYSITVATYALILMFFFILRSHFQTVFIKIFENNLLF